MLQFDSGTASSLEAQVTIPSSNLGFIDGISGFVLENENSFV